MLNKKKTGGRMLKIMAMILTFALCITFNANANANASALDELKKTPASKYDVGKIRLEVKALMLTQRLKNSEVFASGFEFKGFRVVEIDNKLYFLGTLEGEESKINLKRCEQLKAQILASDPSFNLAKISWPNLKVDQAKALESELIFVIELVSTEDDSRRLKCK